MPSRLLLIACRDYSSREPRVNGRSDGDTLVPVEDDRTVLYAAALAGLVCPGAPEAGYYKTVDCGHE